MQKLFVGETNNTPSPSNDAKASLAEVDEKILEMQNNIDGVLPD